MFMILVTVQQKFSVIILFQEFENKRIFLLTGIIKNYKKEANCLYSPILTNSQ